MPPASTLVRGTVLGLRLSTDHILTLYVYVPAGVVAILGALYGIDRLLVLVIHFTFPALVVGMLGCFVLLCLLLWLLGRHKTARVVALLDVPCGWLLRWINVFFLPSFMTLPLSDHVGVREAFVITAVFTIGFAVQVVVTTYLVKGLQLVVGVRRKNGVIRADEVAEENEEVPLRELLLPSVQNTQDPFASGAVSIVDVAPTPVREGSTTPPSSTAPLLAPPPRAALGGDAIKGLPTATTIADREYHNDRSSTTGAVCQRETYLLIQLRYENELVEVKRVATFVSTYLDWMVFGALLVVGIPIYFAVDYAMPLQLAIGVLLFRVALLPSAKLRQYFHPILTLFPVALFVYYLFLLLHQRTDFLNTLRLYKTGRTYLYLWNVPAKYAAHPPGAGDVLLLLMEVLIVLLSLPMHTYRHDMKRHFFVLAPLTAVMVVWSFFGYPPLCYAVGIQAQRALAFSGRSVTLALANPLVALLGGLMQLVAVTAVLLGIVGVVLGPMIMRVMRIRRDDYVTKGVMFGLNSLAVATAWLMTSDPRAAALSSLAFALYGAAMVILAAIPALTQLVKLWVGM